MKKMAMWDGEEEKDNVGKRTFSARYMPIASKVGGGGKGRGVEDVTHAMVLQHCTSCRHGY